MAQINSLFDPEPIEYGKIIRWRQGEIIGLGSSSIVYSAIRVDNNTLLAVKKFKVVSDVTGIDQIVPDESKGLNSFFICSASLTGKTIGLASILFFFKKRISLFLFFSSFRKIVKSQWIGVVHDLKLLK